MNSFSFQIVRLATALGEIVVVPRDEQDIEFQLSYLYSSSREFLSQIGFDLGKLPGKELDRARLLQKVEEDRSKQTFHAVAARLGTRTIACVSLPLTELPDVPRGHFHIFDSMLRGKGLGAPILKAGLRLLMEHHGLQRIFIEPKVDNVPMNRLLSKAGFRHLGETTFSGPSTCTFQARRYEVTVKMLT